MFTSTLPTVQTTTATTKTKTTVRNDIYGDEDPFRPITTTIPSTTMAIPQFFNTGTMDATTNEINDETTTGSFPQMKTLFLNLGNDFIRSKSKIQKYIK